MRHLPAVSTPPRGLDRFLADITRVPTHEEFERVGARLWGRLLGDEKRDLIGDLVAAQRALCCYCQRRIEHGRGEPKERCHVEHLVPRSRAPARMFDPANLAVSCEQGSDEQPRVPLHCGATKGDWPAVANQADFISPRDADCGDHFTYTVDGRIRSSDASTRVDAAVETIDRLKLDIPLLRSQRQSAISPFVDLVLAGLPVEEVLAGVRAPDSGGQLTPFAGVVEAVLSAL